jgi:hypothetical protein
MIRSLRAQLIRLPLYNYAVTDTPVVLDVLSEPVVDPEPVSTR